MAFLIDLRMSVICFLKFFMVDIMLTVGSVNVRKKNQFYVNLF
jgi:hypothetical protein